MQRHNVTGVKCGFEVLYDSFDRYCVFSLKVSVFYLHSTDFGHIAQHSKQAIFIAFQLLDKCLLAVMDRLRKMITYWFQYRTNSYFQYLPGVLPTVILGTIIVTLAMFDDHSAYPSQPELINARE